MLPESLPVARASASALSSEAGAARTAQGLRALVSRLRRRIVELADNAELTPSQTSLLSRLGKQGPQTASALAAAERVRPQSVAATLSVLIERELVARDPDPDDGRRQLISLTGAGRDLFEGRRQAGQEWLSGALETLYSEPERQAIARALDLLERLVE